MFLAVNALLMLARSVTLVADPHELVKQELSYHQQVARQLRTQYAAGICRLKYYTVTLKSRLRVTQGHLTHIVSSGTLNPTIPQGHWKWNHWIDHTRLSSSRVI